MQILRSKPTFLVIIMLLPVLLFGQYKLRINVLSSAKPHPSDSLYIAGSFNQWNPGANALKREGNGQWSIEAQLLPATYQFKLTRGSWDKGETSSTGAGIENRSIRLAADTSIDVVVEGWADDFEALVKKHTASPNVSVIDTAFRMPQLNRARRIWIYLPKEYAQSKKRYPVLYMQDGQNLFDELTSGYGEWGVDECLDSIAVKENKPSIIVGIDNGPKRLNEYNPYSNTRFGEGEGKAYTDFIVNTLKPFIDRHYRTVPGKEFTAIAGSSMGGLISYYAAITRPDVFGKAGIFSPSFWLAPELVQLTDSLAPKIKSKVFFYMGEKEGDDDVKKMEDMAAHLGTVSASLIYSAIDPEGEHKEKYWRKWFPEFYRWIMADWTNYVIRPKN